ncbi:MAG: cytochrome c [Nitrospinae bacterium]|nr:cytochrome c [Nitrospinota bacterium]
MKKQVCVSVALGAVLIFAPGCTRSGDGQNDPAPSSPRLTGAAAGEALFDQKCAICHDRGATAKVGPGLKGTTGRHSEAWLTAWIGDPQGTWDAKAPETEAMKAALGKSDTPMTAMKNRELTPEEIANLIAFLKKNDGK